MGLTVIGCAGTDEKCKHLKVFLLIIRKLDLIT